LLDEVQASYESIWTGKHCGGCRLRSRCPQPLDTESATKATRTVVRRSNPSLTPMAFFLPQRSR
jgi:heterodisulfide reductase subunit C